MKKTEIRDAYDKYLWEKCSRMTYFRRIKMGMNFIEALKPVKSEERHPKNKIKTDKFCKEMEWYYEQPWEKIWRSRFYQRLYQWYPKEEAIKIEFWVHKKGTTIVKKPAYVRPPVFTQRKISPDYEEIKIRYKKEEADIIRREYERMLDEIEYVWRWCDDPIEAKEINDKIEKLKNEYRTFCLINY